jgi:hypothetical protein
VSETQNLFKQVEEGIDSQERLMNTLPVFPNSDNIQEKEDYYLC